MNRRRHHRRSPHRVVLAVTLVAVVLGACTTTVGGQAQWTGEQPAAGSASAPPGSSAPRPGEPPAPEIPYNDEMAPYLDAMETMRTWDPCAMHDIAAAEDVFGGPANYIVPIDPIDRCDLSTEYDGGSEALSVTLSLRIESHLEENYRSGYFDDGELPRDKTIYQSLPPEEGTATFGDSCAIFLPYKNNLGIHLDVTATDEPERQLLCQLVEDYFTALIPKMTDPPLAEEGLTAPRIPLYGTNPCVATIPAVEKHPQDRYGNPHYVIARSPYSCSVESVDTYETIMVGYQSFSGISPDAEELTLADTTVHRVDSMTCRYQLVAVDPIKFNVDDPDFPGRAPGLQIEMDECDDELAEQMITRALDQDFLPETPVAGDALELGRLR